MLPTIYFFFVFCNFNRPKIHKIIQIDLFFPCFRSKIQSKSSLKVCNTKIGKIASYSKWIGLTGVRLFRLLFMLCLHSSIYQGKH